MNRFDLNFPFAHGAPPAQAQFRAQCEDFVVHEQLGFEPAGQGEHLLLEIRKRDDNTPWVAKQIARLAGVKAMDVGYCGLKDRRAVTRQWFSVYLPKGEVPDWRALDGDTIQFLQASRHSHKLRPGQHAGNAFEIRLRQVQGERESLEQRLMAVALTGVPNYFGEQRFGRGADNLVRAEQLLKRELSVPGAQRGMLLSAARSWLFNLVLAERVRLGNWSHRLPGEPDAEASGPLWGRGRNLAQGQLAELEAACLAPWADWCHGLEHSGLSQARRGLLLRPLDLRWQWQGDDLQLGFQLPPGQFATSLLRELAQLQVPGEDSQL